jgi:hypothetical protein
MTKQGVIPGTDIDRHRDLDAAGEKYVEARDIRMQCSQAESEAKEELHALITELCRVWGYEDPVARVQIDDAQRASILASALSDSARRRLEREHHLPAGALDG